MISLGRIYDVLRRRFNYYTHRLIVGGVCDPILMDQWPVPAGMRSIAHKAARSVGAACEGFLNLPSIPVSRMTNADWSVIFYGSAQSREDLEYILFKERAKIEPLGRVMSWRLRSHIAQTLNQGADLIVYERPGGFYPRPLDAPVAFEVPTWIDQSITLPEDPHQLIAGKKHSSRRNYINRAQSEGYVAEISHDPSELVEFFHTLHEPFIAERHKARTRSIALKDARRSHKQGALVKIMQGDRLVGGMINYQKDDVSYNTTYGLLLTGPEIERRMIGTFIDWSCVLYAHEQNSATLNLGGSLPLLSDGIFQKKKSWHSKVTERMRTYKRWTFFAQDLKPALRERLNELGLITHLNGAYYAVEIGGASSAHGIEARAAKMNNQGLSGIALVEPGSPISIHRSEQA